MANNVYVHVQFDAVFKKDDMPSAYTEIEYFTDAIRENVEDAMTDLGAADSKNIEVEIEGLDE
jgi:hypothetical protein